MTQTTIDIELEQIFDSVLACHFSTVEGVDCPNPADWKVVTTCCGRLLLMCDNCLRALRMALILQPVTVKDFCQFCKHRHGDGDQPLKVIGRVKS